MPEIEPSVDEARAAALALLTARRAGDIAHPGGDLLSHLVRTEWILREWGADESTCRAALCHAAYGTDGFPVALLELEERPVLRDAIGTAAEHLVYVYCACDRDVSYPTLATPNARFTDRFTHETTAANDADVRSFVLITIANELDLARAGAFDAATIESLASLFRELAPVAPDEAELALRELEAG